MKKTVECDLTIFLGDVRINTTIVQNGKRLIGTKLKPQIAEIVIRGKQNYTAKLKSWFTFYNFICPVDVE
jgi:methyl-accepting chemotaxis protein